MIRAAIAALLAATVGCGPATVASSQSPPPSPTASTHTNAVLGYTVTLPPPWRLSGCLSRVETAPEQTLIGQDILTWHSVPEEQDLGVTGGTGAVGAFAWVISVIVQTSGQSASEYATARLGGVGGRVATDTIDGRPAARIDDGAGNALAYYVANAGRVYSIGLTVNSDPRPVRVSPATFDAIAHSVRLTTPAARPTPTAVPIVTAAVEQIADAVAAAFAASDADRLRDLMTPVCWFNAGYNQSEGSAASRDKVAAGLRTSFTQGLKVTVEPRPIMTKPPMPGSFWIWSTWSEYGVPPRTTPRSNVQLVFDQIDGRWYWVGALFNAVR